MKEICALIPAFNNEIDWTRGVTKKSSDDLIYTFKNGSTIDILAASEHSRGQRRTGGTMEEVILIDGTILNEVIIPTTNITRLLPDGTRHPEEVVNQSQVYITTAGFKNTFCYDKLIELMIASLIDPDEYCVTGGSFDVPVKEGLLPTNFVAQLRLSDTFKEDSFDREYRSKWAGEQDGAFYDADKFDKCRTILLAEKEKTNRSKNSYYVIGVDVGRKECTTEAVIIKVLPQPVGSAIKAVVNIITLDAEHFEEQAIAIKQLYYRYKARGLIIDANGLGQGLVDFMLKSQIDPETGDTLPDFGVINDDEKFYRKYRTDITELNAMYLMKATAPINTEIYSYLKAQIFNGRIKFLIDENQAKVKLMSTKVGQSMDANQRNDYLRPYIMTSILKEQLLNLHEENEGLNIILKQISRSIKKDKVSALGYAMYFIKKEEESKKRRKAMRASDLLFFG